MFHDDVLKKLRAEISGRRAIEYIQRFWCHDRLSTFPGFHRAAAETAQIMREAGLSEVEILEYPCDGKALYSDLTSPQGWDAVSGFLEVTGADGMVRRIADRSADPCHFFVWCGNTGPEGVRTTIVHSSSDDIKGKLVFQDKAPLDDSLRRRLIDGGALGLVSDELPCWPDVRERSENMNVIRWNNAFLYPGNPENLLAFQVSPESGDWLRAVLNAKGAADCFARVDTRLYDDTVPVTTGIVRGSEEPDKEIWLIQHLHEPGAHDNASGVASAIELARAITALAARGEIAAPRRSIRVICSWEMLGFQAHLSHNPHIAKNVLAAINPDMAGPDQDRCKSWLQYFVTPHSNPSFMDELGLKIIQDLYADHPRWRYEVMEYMINDNFLSDSVIGIPCTAFIFLRDRYYHSSSDRPENLSPAVLGEVSAAMGAYAWTLAAGGPEAARDCAALVRHAAFEALSRAAEKLADGAAFDERAQYLLFLYQRKLARMDNLAVSAGERKQIEAIAGQTGKEIAEFAARLRPADGKRFERKAQSEAERKADRIVPRRLIAGPLSLTRVPEAVKKERGLECSCWNYEQNAPMCWSDGQRSLFEIQWLVGQELGKAPTLESLFTLFDTLKEYGYMELGERA